MKTRVVLIVLLLVGASAVAGCIKRKTDVGEDLEQARAQEILGDAGRDRLADAAAIIPKNYSFPEQRLLPPVSVSFTGKATSDALGSYEGERDESGIEHGTVVQMQDISSLVPVGQPVELVIDLIWDASEFNSADLDIVVDVPGTSTSYSPVSETFNWNLAVKTMVVNTVGVAGRPAQVGVQIASGAVTEGFEYTLEVQATYVKDVLTPYHPWAFEVPRGASGIILESEKAGGEEHITAHFLVIDPEDNLVQAVDFNDIDIPTQSVFIPTSKPGTYVFYAHFMHGGFLRLKADVPLDANAAYPLKLVETKVVDSNAPAPGIAGKDVFNGSALEKQMPRDDVNAITVGFTPDGPFPLRVLGYVTGPVVSQAKITLKSPLGEVHRLTVIGRYAGDHGTLGYTSDHEGGQNNLVDWSKVQKGAWTAEIVNTSPGVEIGHTVLTYQRS